jgi:hypothetical protein
VPDSVVAPRSGSGRRAEEVKTVTPSGVESEWVSAAGASVEHAAHTATITDTAATRMHFAGRARRLPHRMAAITLAKYSGKAAPDREIICQICPK